MRRHLTYANVMSTIAMSLALAGGTATAAKLISGRDIRDGSIAQRDLRADAAGRTFLLDGPGNLSLGATPVAVLGPLTIGPSMAGVNVISATLSVYQRIDVPLESTSLVVCALRHNTAVAGAARVTLPTDSEPGTAPNAEQIIHLEGRASLKRGDRVVVLCDDPEGETRVAAPPFKPRLILRRGRA